MRVGKQNVDVRGFVGEGADSMGGRRGEWVYEKEGASGGVGEKVEDGATRGGEGVKRRKEGMVSGGVLGGDEILLEERAFKEGSELPAYHYNNDRIHSGI